MRHHPLTGIAFAVMLAAVAGCATVKKAETQIVADLPSAKAAATTALNLWGIAKGIALVAEAADPALVAPLSVAIAVTDPLVLAAHQALADAAADASSVTTLAAQITAQANAITATAAPAIKVVASK